MLSNTITSIRQIFKHMHSCENKKNTFETLGFSHYFSKVKEFAYVWFCKEDSKVESDRIASINGK